MSFLNLYSYDVYKNIFKYLDIKDIINIIQAFNINFSINIDEIKFTNNDLEIIDLFKKYEHRLNYYILTIDNKEKKIKNSIFDLDIINNVNIKKINL